MLGWQTWALRLIIATAIAGFAVGAWGMYQARKNTARYQQQGVEFRREICIAVNGTRAGVRKLVDLAFQPGIDKQNDPAARDAIRAFRETVKQPVSNLDCHEIVNP